MSELERPVYRIDQSETEHATLPDTQSFTELLTLHDMNRKNCESSSQRTLYPYHLHIPFVASSWRIHLRFFESFLIFLRRLPWNTLIFVKSINSFHNFRIHYTSRVKTKTRDASILTWRSFFRQTHILNLSCPRSMSMSRTNVNQRWTWGNHLL